MKNDVKDVQYCQQGGHMVPRDQMTKLRSDDGKTERSVCIACREATLEYRAERMALRFTRKK